MTVADLKEILTQVPDHYDVVVELAGTYYGNHDVEREQVERRADLQSIHFNLAEEGM